VVQQSNIPNRLFRYRPFNKEFDEETKQEKWKNELFDGFVFPTCPKYFNDPYDCDLSIDYKVLFNEESKRILISYLEKICELTNDDRIRIMNSTDIFQDIKIIHLKHKIDLIPNYEDEILKILESVSKKYRERISVVCLSKRNDSILMWSHYSVNHTGFCIEYNLINNEKINAGIKPINYNKKRFLIRDVKNEKNWLEKAVLSKSNDWSYEKEWRIILYQEIKSSNPLVLKDYIKAVYLGAKTTENYITEVSSFFKNTDIPVYQMQLVRDKFKLITKLLI